MSSNQGQTPDLTDRQRSLLQSAVQEGYFKVPRTISTVELAERHGMSDRETSETIRRGIDIVLRSALCDE